MYNINDFFQDWSKKKKITVVVLGVIGITAIAILVWYFFIRKSGNPNPPGGCPKGTRPYGGKCVPDCTGGEKQCKGDCYDPNVEECTLSGICDIDKVCSSGSCMLW